MSLDTTQKQQLINTHQTHATDTGSAEVQVAMLTERISKLSSHLQNNIHDFSSRQGFALIGHGWEGLEAANQPRMPSLPIRSL